MATDVHTLTFSDEEYEKAAKKWQREFILMPLFAAKDTLRYMTGMPGVRYKVALPTVEGQAQFAPYRSDRKAADTTRMDFREIGIFFGNVRIDFEPNKYIQMLIGESAAFLGDGQAQAPSAKLVIAAVMKSLGHNLNDALLPPNAIPTVTRPKTFSTVGELSLTRKSLPETSQVPKATS